MRKNIDKLATTILRFLPVFLIVTVPLFFLPLTPDFFQINKQFLVFVVASIALLLFCIRLVTRGHIQISLTPALLPLTGFTIITLLSTLIQHPNPRFALMNTTAVTVSLFIIYLAVTSSQKAQVVIKSVIIGIITTIVILGIFTLLSHFGVLSQLSGPEWLKSKLFHPTGGYFHFLILSIPVLIATISYGVVTKSWITKPLILAAAIIIAASAAFSLKNILPSTEAAGIALLPYQAGWSIAVDTFKNLKTALLGTGPDTYGQVFNRLRPANLNMDNNLWNLRFQTSSSELLTLLTTVGIFGLLFYILAYLKTIKALLKEHPKTDPETVFLIAGLISTILLFALVPSSITSTVLGLVLLLAGAVKLKVENSQSVKDVQLNLSTRQIHSAYSDISTNEQVGLPILPWLLTVCSVVLLAIFWNINSRTYAANLTIFEAAQNVKDNPVKSYNKQIEAANLDPLDPFLKMNLSQTYIAVTKSYLTKEKPTDEDKKKALEFANQALNEAKAASNLRPYDVTVWENFAGIARFLAEYQVQGANDWTLATYTQAISLDPTNPTLRAQLGTFYFFLGDIDQATKVLSQAIELKPNWNIPYYNIALAYKSTKDYQRALVYMKEAKKYTSESDKEDMERIDAEIKELEALVPKDQTTAPTTQEAK